MSQAFESNLESLLSKLRADLGHQEQADLTDMAYELDMLFLDTGLEDTETKSRFLDVLEEVLDYPDAAKSEEAWHLVEIYRPGVWEPSELDRQRLFAILRGRLEAHQPFMTCMVGTEIMAEAQPDTHCLEAFEHFAQSTNIMLICALPNACRVLTRESGHAPAIVEGSLAMLAPLERHPREEVRAEACHYRRLIAHDSEDENHSPPGL